MFFSLLPRSPRGPEFRKEYNHLGELRSLAPDNVCIMAATATATMVEMKVITSSLGLVNPVIISASPSKPNIYYALSEFQSFDETFKDVVHDLMVNPEAMGSVIIFCPTISDCSDVYLHFRSALGSRFLFPSDAPDLCKYRRVEVYHAVIAVNHKEEIAKYFVDVSRPLKVVIATIAFGMGINCSAVSNIIHYGCPENARNYIQQSGRAGRNGQQAVSTVYWRKRQRSPVGSDMKRYVSLPPEKCRREFLFANYCGYHEQQVDKSLCCDNCTRARDGKP